MTNGPYFFVRSSKKNRAKLQKLTASSLKLCSIQYRDPAPGIPLWVTEKDRILVVSHDPGLADVRRKVLEKAGFEVLAATDPNVIQATCASHKPRLVMIGYSLQPSEKRRVWAAVKEHCEVPVLELHRESGPELISPDFSHESLAPDDFLATVMKILSSGKGR